MKIFKNEIINPSSKNEIFAHLILHCIGQTPYMLQHVNTNTNSIDVVLTIDGKEVPIQDFCGYWQSQVDNMLKEEAMRIVDEKLEAIREKLTAVKDAFEEEFDKGIRPVEQQTDILPMFVVSTPSYYVSVFADNEEDAKQRVNSWMSSAIRDLEGSSDKWTVLAMRSDCHGVFDFHEKSDQRY